MDLSLPLRVPAHAHLSSAPRIREAHSSAFSALCSPAASALLLEAPSAPGSGTGGHSRAVSRALQLCPLLSGEGMERLSPFHSTFHQRAKTTVVERIPWLTQYYNQGQLQGFKFLK